MMENIEEEYTSKGYSIAQIQQLKKEDLAYKNKMLFLKKWPVFEKMNEGNQWPPINPSDPDTRDLPRPVFNIISYIGQHEVNSVINQDVKPVFALDEGQTEEFADDDETMQVPDQFNIAAKATWEDLNQDKLIERCSYNAENKGIGLTHYFLDQKKGGRKIVFEDTINGEDIDPMNIFFGNPNDIEIQSQPLIGIYNRESIKDLKAQAKNNGATDEDISLITADTNTQDINYEAAQVEMQGSNMTNTILLYWKEDVPVQREEQTQQPNLETGEMETVTEMIDDIEKHVFYMKVTDSCIIVKPTDMELTLYPLAKLNWNEKRFCIFGYGDTEGIIPNQRIINLLLASQALSVQLTGFPKIIYKGKYINREALSNRIGAMIEDLNPGTGFSAQYMSPGPISPIAQTLTENFMQYTKTLLGANESSTGELNKAGQMNAQAISLLQSASAVPLDGKRKRKNRYLKDCIRIWEDFYKRKYKTARIMSAKDEEGKEQSIVFRGTDHANVGLKLRIDIGPSDESMEQANMQTLTAFHASGDITFKQLLKYAPKNQIPYKDQLLADIEKMEQEQLQAQQQQLISSLNPEERQAFESSTPEQQKAILQDLMQQNSQVQGQNNQQPTNTQQKPTQ